MAEQPLCPLLEPLQQLCNKSGESISSRKLAFPHTHIFQRRLGKNDLFAELSFPGNVGAWRWQVRTIPQHKATPKLPPFFPLGGDGGRQSHGLLLYCSGVAAGGLGHLRREAPQKTFLGNGYTRNVAAAVAQLWAAIPTHLALCTQRAELRNYKRLSRKICLSQLCASLLLPVVDIPFPFRAPSRITCFFFRGDSNDVDFPAWEDGWLMLQLFCTSEVTAK